MKENIEKKDSEKEKNEQNKKIEFQSKITAYIFFGIIVITIASFLIANNLRHKENKFVFEGVTFEKKKFGELTIYEAVKNIETENGIVPYVLKVKNDPRDMKEINVSAEIKFRRRVFVSYSSETRGCENISLAGSTIGSFLGSSGIVVIGAASDKDYAEEKNIDYVVCNNSIGDTVIMVDIANYSTIYQDETYRDCYHISFSCENAVKTMERFIIAALFRV